MLPKHITQHVARMRLTQVEANSTLRIVEEIETESRKLADVDVDVIVLAATAPSSRNGIGYDRGTYRAHQSAASGKPATTASTALLEALRALSAKTIVLGAPWGDAINRTTAAFIEANGLTWWRRQRGRVDNLDIGLLDPQSAYDVGRRIDRPEADAVACWRAATGARLPSSSGWSAIWASRY